MRGTLHKRVVAGLAVGLCALWIAVGLAQAPPAPAPSVPPVNQSDDPLLKNFEWRSIGPASMGGRIDDIEVVESDTAIQYVGFATGGVWKTVNNGTTWTPIFDTYPVSSVGDIAIARTDPNIIWVGTGEPNNRQSSSFGDGIYKSTDGGKTFTNMGLKDSQSIARVVIHPKNPDIVYVAVVGHLFGPNKERGLYKTTDGGRTWVNTKFVDEDTGFTDVVMDPSKPDTLFAASYQRRRQPWGFNGGGPGSGIWKTTDGGRTWTKLQGSGLPEGIIGRIGLDICRSRPNVIYAQIEVGASAGSGANVTADGKPVQPGAGARPPAPPAPRQPGEKPAPPDPKRSGVWRSDDKGKTWKLVSNNDDRPMYYSQIRVDPNNPDILYTCGAPFHKSVDGGKTFKTVPGIAHSDHHALWIDPKNSRHLILGNDGGLDVSYDQADTWEFVNTMAVGQFYAVAVDMQRPYRVCGGLQDNGSFCGPSATRGSSITNADWFRIGGGDGFYVQVDPTNPDTIYVESQDGAVNRLDLATGRNTSIRPRAPQAPRPAGAGPSPAQDAQAQAMATMAAQFGFRGGPPNVQPTPPAGTQFRFFWNTPVLLSPHNPRTVYVGGNRLFTSVDRGDTWTMTEDLTRNIDRFSRPIMGVPGDAPMASKHDGAGSYSQIVTIGESPIVPGVLWVGTNDGNLQISRDGGATWKSVADNVPDVPKETHVSRVEPSHFDAGTCYVTFDGHRTDDMKPYVYVTRDYGATWTSIAGNLPTGNVNVIREDPRNKSLLYLGTEYAFYISLNGGKEWKRFMVGLPVVRVDDILVHPRDNDLIVATHGRSFYIIDDITPLQQLDEKALAADVSLFNVRPGVLWRTDPTLNRVVGGSKNFLGKNPAPGTAITYYLKAAPSDDVKITISDVTGKVVRDITGTKEAGLNRVQWNLRGNAPARPAAAAGAAATGAQVPAGVGAGAGGGRFGAMAGLAVEPGTYVVKITAAGKTLTTTVVVEADER
jgi:photosystem II stability/assembly factor-like uncharacterized protein